MHPYIEDTKFAASELIKLISSEEKELSERIDHLRCAKELEGQLYDEFIRSEMNIDDNVVDLKLRADYGRFMAQSQRNAQASKRIEELKISIDAKQTSIQALCGALLQISKQGISYVYGNNCPHTGRTIGSENLKNIIWQARNQYMHYDEGFNQQVTACFANLEREQGGKFHLQVGVNLSKEVIELLGWKEYDNYENDMISLLP